MPRYALDFISDEDLLEHVKQTVSQYRFEIDLKAFNKNLVDPIKLSFDASVYGKSMEEMIESEIVRQIDKSNTNHIGYFHQNIFKYFGAEWEVPDTGFDVINTRRNIFVEMKNKHNTMNSSAAQKTYIKMQDTLLRNDQATCMLVEVIAKDSQNKKWTVSVNSEQMSHEKIRRVSIDQFYSIVTGDPLAFKKLCNVLPQVIEDAVKSLGINSIKSTVIDELNESADSILDSLYLMAFSKYEGFSLNTGDNSE
ncbi:MAG: Eco47II family restriction endonuclease [Opitutaceae bacterium]